MGEAHGSCAEGRAVLGTRQKKIQRKIICVTLNEPPDADPHVRWCERERLAAAPYSIDDYLPLLTGCEDVASGICHWLRSGMTFPPSPSLKGKGAG